MTTVNRLKIIYGWFLKRYRFIKNNLFGHKDYRKAVIICHARTGSNMLISLLNSHPNALFGGELFDFLKDRTSNSIWSNHFRKYPKSVKVLGFKLFYAHPFDGERDVWDYIKNDKSILIIHLGRKNLFRSYVSFQIAEKTKKWHESINTKDLPNDKKVSINIDGFYEYFDAIEQQIKSVQEQFSNTHKYIEITYEDLLVDRQSVVDRLIALMGIAKFKVTTKMIRQNAEPLHQLVTNFEEVTKKFEMTKFQKFLD